MKLLLLDLFNADLSPLARTEIRKAGGAEGVGCVGWGESTIYLLLHCHHHRMSLHQMLSGVSHF